MVTAVGTSQPRKFCTTRTALFSSPSYWISFWYERMSFARQAEVGGRVLQRAHGAGTVELVRHVPAVGQPGEAHGQVGAERLAPHLDVVDRVRDAVLDLVVQLPEPAADHRLDRAPELTPSAVGHRPRRPHPEVGQAALHRVGRGRRRAEVERHELRQPRVEDLRAGHVPVPAEQLRKVVVGVGAPGEPAGRHVQRLGGGVRVDHRGAVGEVVAGQLGLGPDAGAGNADHRVVHAHPAGPVERVLAGRVQVRALLGRERHVKLGQ